MPNFSLFNERPVLAQLSTGGAPVGGLFSGPPPQVGGPPAPSPAPQGNPMIAPIDTGAALLKKLLEQQMLEQQQPQSSQFQPLTPDISGGVPAITREMFENPGYDPKQIERLQQANMMLMNEATSGQYDAKGNLNTKGKIMKYGDAAGQILQGLGGLGAAFGPAGAAKGFNTYLEAAQKQAMEKRKLESENRKAAIEGMDKLAEVMGKSRKYTVNDIEAMLKVHKAQGEMDKLGSEKAKIDSETELKQLEQKGERYKNIKDIMAGIRDGSAAFKDTRTAEATNELGNLRQAQTETAKAKGDTEATKQGVNRAKVDEIKAGTSLKQAQAGKAVADTGVAKERAKTQGAVQKVLEAKSKKIAASGAPQDPAKHDAVLYKGLPPGAANDPFVRKVRDEMIKDGHYNEAGVAYLVNLVKGMKKYQKQSGGGLTPLPGAQQHG